MDFFDEFSECPEFVRAILFSNDLDKIKIILTKGFGVNNKKGSTGITLLHSADSLEVTKELLRNGASVSTKSKQYQQTPLHYAAMFNKDIDIIKELVKSGSDIRAIDKESRTALHYTIISNKNPDVALYLINQSPQVNNVDDQGRSPLHYATINDRAPILIQTLLGFGANVCLKDIKGRTPLHYAAISSNEPTGIHELLMYGADIDMKDIHGKTPLHHAVMNHNKPYIIKELLKNGADPNIQDDLGYTPLHLATATEKRNLETLKDLIMHGANVTIGRDEFFPFFRYCTPMDKAMYKRDYECAALLSKISLVMNFNIDCIKCINLERYNEYPDHALLLCFTHECFLELKKMFDHKIVGEVTLFKLVRQKEKVIRPMFMNKESTEQQILSNYPIYQDMILPYIEMCFHRGNLLTRIGKVRFYTRTYPSKQHNNTIETDLNFDCVRNVADYLSNDDLSNWIGAYEGVCSAKKTSVGCMPYTFIPTKKPKLFLDVPKVNNSYYNEGKDY